MSNTTLPLVSIIIPARNMQEYIGETLQSVCDADYGNLEIIVTDDGSTDRTVQIAEEYAAQVPRLSIIRAQGRGVCHARNAAIRQARGKYIFPLDADDLLKPGFIAEGVQILESDSNVKAVIPKAEFFGEKTGEWKLPQFSIRALARHNMIPVSCLYRRSDWERTGGYCERLRAREDWEFWISVLKDGGEVVRSNSLGLMYRIRKSSKRISDRKYKKELVRVLNERHADFFEKHLGGPLRLHRSWSRIGNLLFNMAHPRRLHLAPEFAGEKYFAKALPRLFRYECGALIYKGRNELRCFARGGKEFVVKSFKTPFILNRIAYGLLRPSKAKRSFVYSEMLNRLGIGAPIPVGYLTVRHGLLFTESYFISLRSECPYTYQHLFDGAIPDAKDYFIAIGRAAGKMHEAGIYHKDFSRGNILIGRTEQGIRTEFVDLNRISFKKNIDLQLGCKNFERLPANPEMIAWLAEGYAAQRGFDPKECRQYISEYRAKQVEKHPNHIKK